MKLEAKRAETLKRNPRWEPNTKLDKSKQCNTLGAPLRVPLGIKKESGENKIQIQIRVCTNTENLKQSLDNKAKSVGTSQLFPTRQ